MFGELYLFLIRGQFKYYVLFVDDYSRMAWLYLMKGRKGVFSKFLSFMNEICTQYSASVKTFRSDNALEYTNLQFKLTSILKLSSMKSRVYILHLKMEFLNVSIGIFLK